MLARSFLNSGRIPMSGILIFLYSTPVAIRSSRLPSRYGHQRGGADAHQRTAKDVRHIVDPDEHLGPGNQHGYSTEDEGTPWQGL